MARGLCATFILGIVLINCILSVVAEESLVFTLEKNHIAAGAKGSDANIRVKITDKAGNAASKAKVTLTKATNRADKKAVTSNQELKAVDATTYELDFIAAAKPTLGLYDLDFAVAPEDNKYEAIKSTKRELKVVGTVTVSDAQVAVSDYSSPDDLQQAKKYTAKYPEAHTSNIAVDSSQYVFISFSLQSGGKSFAAHQVIASLVSKDTQLETNVAASYDGSKYTISLPIASFTDDFYGNSGDYQLTVTVGDALITPFVWKIATLSLKFPDQARKPIPVSPFANKKEIQHVFRVPEKRPPLAISSAFTLAVLAPWAILFFGFIFVGANIKNFPTDAGFIWAVGFQGTLGAILALFGLYWLSLNMIQTLTYLGVLSVPFLFFSQKALHHLALANAANAKKTQ